MSDETALTLSTDELQQLGPLLRDPDDDSPRLAFAAWCERHSDPRGAFIRAQLLTAKTPNPLEPDFDPARVAARATVGDLLARFGEQWTRFIRPFARGATFYRGFIMLVTDSAREFLQDADKLFALAPIQQLDITALDIDLGELLSSPHLERLRGLSIRRAGLGDDGARQLAAAANLSNLRFLDIGQNGVGEEGAIALIQSPHLTRLALVHFDGNLVDLRPSVGTDQGMVVDWSPSPAAARLMERYGKRLWLDYVGGNRFSVATWLKA